MAGEEIQNLDSNLKQLGQSTGYASIEFTGFTKRLIKMSDSARNSGKAWTTFSRLVSGTPLWSLQNKFRGIIEVFAGFERRSQENTKAYNDELQATLANINSYSKLRTEMIALQAVMSEQDGGVTALSDSQKEALESTIEFAQAQALGKEDTESYAIAYGALAQKMGRADKIQRGMNQKLATSFALGEKGTMGDRQKVISTQLNRGFNKELRRFGKGIQAPAKLLFAPIKILGTAASVFLPFSKISTKFFLGFSDFVDRVSGLITHVAKFLIMGILGFMAISAAIPLFKKLYDKYKELGFIDEFKRIGKMVASFAKLLWGAVGSFLSGDYDAGLEFLISAGYKLKDIAFDVLKNLFNMAVVAGASAIKGIIAFFNRLKEDPELRAKLFKVITMALAFYLGLLFIKLLLVSAAHIAGIYLLPVMMGVVIAAAIKNAIPDIKQIIMESLSGLGKTLNPKKWFGGGKANGGMTDGRINLVGERGPELVKLPAGSRVYSNSDSKRMLGGGQSVVNNFNVTINAKDTSDAEMRRIADELGKHFAKNVTRSFQSGLLR